MAGNNAGNVIIPGHGQVLISKTDEAEPFDPAGVVIGDPKTWPAEWIALGHTSRENTIEFERDGGEEEVLGSWEEDAIESNVSEAEVTSFKVASLEMSKEIYQLMFGAGGEWNETLQAIEHDEAQSTIKSVMVIAAHGGKRWARYIRKSSLIAGDESSIETDNFMEANIKGTVLSPGNGRKKQMRFVTRPFNKDAAPLNEVA